MVNQGERAENRKALVAKETLRKSGGRAGKVNVLTREISPYALTGDVLSTEREVSRGHSRQVIC